MVRNRSMGAGDRFGQVAVACGISIGSKLVAALGYSVGFLIVIVGRPP
jgi:hypothetical protein